MRVLIVNKFFYPRGGDCVVAMGTRELLIEAGHTVQVFAMHHPLNISLPESGSFASQIDFSGSLSQKVKAFGRLVGLGDISVAFRKVLLDFKPDVIHVHNIHSYLSPVICRIAHDSGIPVVWTLHDFKLVCPAYTFRKGNGEICDYAATGKCSPVRNRCLKNSLTASAMAAVEKLRWSMPRLNRMTDAYIAPSHFMSEMMMLGGADKDKMNVIYNFVDPAKLRILARSDSRSGGGGDDNRYFAYTGRLSFEKGVATLIQAAIQSGVNLRIAGDGPMRAQLEAMAAGHKGITFLGRLDAEAVAALQRDADACVCPSEWFENNPLAVIESLCAGTPVIGADIGGIPELITPGVNGFLYKSGDTNALARILNDFSPSSFDKCSIARDATEKFSTRTHLDRILNIYQSCIR
ncbi:glycosyltransferase family 4 protein [Duncaniella muricolitica]|jgi:glycosyltransferase involved in cell wall biosynthesis|uniref:glycosyltransferase family 4 protein n=1 Tax=Duncaniella muricolitica TaxID=2880704 RepID=UPI00244DFBDA|nr:glycosyltransferase family 4 protein [Duncaniella muricolitica]